MSKMSLLLAVWQVNKRLSWLTAGLLLVNLGAFGWLYFVSSPRLESLERNYIERQADLRRQSQDGHLPRHPQAEFWTTKEDLQKFRALIPPKTEFTALIRELFLLADAAGLDINQINYDPKPVAGRNLLDYALDFLVVGDYPQIKQFIYSLEQSERLIIIESIALSGGKDTDEGRVALNLRLSTLFRTDKS